MLPGTTLTVAAHNNLLHSFKIFPWRSGSGGSQISVCSRIAWSTQWVPGQLELHRETLSWNKTKQPIYLPPPFFSVSSSAWDRALLCRLGWSGSQWWLLFQPCACWGIDSISIRFCSFSDCFFKKTLCGSRRVTIWIACLPFCRLALQHGGC